LKEKLFVHFFKKDPHYDSESTENQKLKEQAMINTQSTLSMKNKNKEQTNLVFSNAKENDLLNQ
jgi:hypothetical protein